MYERQGLERRSNRNTRNQPQKAVIKKGLCLLLSLLLVVVLAPQVPIYADEPAPTATPPSPAPADKVATPESEQYEEPPFATLAEAEEAGVASPVPDDPGAYANGEVIVMFAGEKAQGKEADAAESAVAEISEQADAADIDTEVLSSEIGEGGVALIKLPDDVSVEEALLQLANDESIVSVEPNYCYTLYGEPIEPIDAGTTDNAAATTTTTTAAKSQAPLNLGSQYFPNDETLGWQLDAINAYDAWGKQQVNGAVTIAVIDTGTRLTHQDLDDNVLTSLAWDAVRSQPLWKSVLSGQINWSTTNNHGTLVASVAAAEANNGFGTAGVSHNARVLPIYVGSGPYLDSAAILRAYDYVLANCQQANIRVMNLSFGGSEEGLVEHAAIIQARERGILVVAAAGNSGNSGSGNADTPPEYPSDYEEVVSAVSVNFDLGHSSFSSHNNSKDIAAPGSSIVGADCKSDLALTFGSGTSFSSPVVAGVAALLFARNPALTPQQAADALYNSATDLGTPGWDQYYGHGLVNANAALAYVDQHYPNGSASATTCTITFDHNDEASTITSVTRVIGGSMGTLPVPTRSGWYAFGGWFTEKTGGTPITASTRVTGAAIYYAHWTPVLPDSYTVTFDPTGGTASQVSVTKKMGAAIGTLPKVTRVGYTFKGWYTAPEGGSKLTTRTKVNTDATYYAQWQANSYTITLRANGGSVSPSRMTKSYDSVLGTLPIPKRTGYTFEGWYTAKSGGTQIGEDTPVVAAKTYYAHWAVNTYTVTYDAMGGEVSPATVLKTHSSAVGTPPTPVRTGYQFGGWYTAASGGSKLSKTAKITADKIYYAHWTAVYTATFDPAGGTVALSSVTKTVGSSIGTLPLPKRTGYTFKGWYTAPEAGSKIGSSTKITADVTYYARWAKK
jgi:uncharacterized repeat protein (TIGR02543 family)